MNAENSSKSHAMGWTVSIGALVLYVLSIGPAIVLDSKGLIPFQQQRWLESLYVPVFWLIDRTPFGKPLEVYIAWWVYWFDA